MRRAPKKLVPGEEVTRLFVKEWDFSVTPPARIGNIGPAQGGRPVVDFFDNHALVGRVVPPLAEPTIYDPSYGIFSDNLLEWEAEALSGYRHLKSGIENWVAEDPVIQQTELMQ